MSTAVAASPFDPDAFIDRVAEQNLFEGLLRFEGDARVITIKDGQGTGKSELLRLLHYKCRYALKVPACLVALDELDHSHLVVKTMERDLRAAGLGFPRFTEVEKRRLDSGGQSLAVEARGQVTANSITGGNQYGLYAEHAHFHGAAMDPDLQDRLREEAVEAFVEDLREVASDVPVALLFDGYEACARAVEDWLPELLRRRVFDPEERADKLVVVIAGQKVPTPTLKLMLGPRYEQVVTYRDQLSTWDREHVIDFLHHEGVRDRYPDEDIDWITAKISKRRWTIGQALDAIRLLKAGID